MYKILGSDGNEYGPVSAGQVKEWIAENRVEKKTPVIPKGGADWVFLDSLPEFAAAFASPPPMVPSAKATKSADAFNKIIPYRNAWALVAYYLGVFSVIPPMGALLGFPALVIGVLGLRFRRRNPEAGGSIHAWIGIILGSLFGLGYLALIALVIIVHKHSMR